ncbi:hypothetical protein [Catenuloplanes indicus]|uniref:Uncharacterized protein n=1 Tax=Catenuloplanes indicus TaxID=137267 RepID=A0AAE3VYA1_9ACTN|nr:hypothetical protein [Catenuloplanes indicus]MDQ0365930.1 hypothetical protein [Catenuloplanes indicus]
MATPDPSGTGSAREEAERLVAAVLARASQGASQAAWMAQGAKFAARASGHETTGAGLGLLGDALRGVAKTASGFSEDLHRHSEGTAGARPAARPPREPAGPSGPATTAAAPRADAPGTRPATPGDGPQADPGSATDRPGDDHDSPAGDGRAFPDGGPRADRDFVPGGVRDGRGFSAGDSQGGAAHAGWATGSAECCVCPVCRAITMVRNPTPEFAEQLATSAGDLAAGVAGLLRAFSTAAADPATWSGPARSAAAGTATRASAGTAAKSGEKAPHEDSGTGWPGEDPWSAATRAAAAGNGGGDPGSSGARGTGDHERESRDGV